MLYYLSLSFLFSNTYILFHIRRLLVLGCVFPDAHFFFFYNYFLNGLATPASSFSMPGEGNKQTNKGFMSKESMGCSLSERGFD